MAAITLKYWSGRGLMEVPRQCLAIAGHFPGQGYTDVRVSGAPPAGAELDANLGRLPCIEGQWLRRIVFPVQAPPQAPSSPTHACRHRFPVPPA